MRVIEIILILAFPLFVSCNSAPYLESRNVSNVISCDLKGNISFDIQDSWLKNNVDITNCKVSITSGSPHLSLVAKSAYSKSISLEYKVVAYKKDSMVSSEGSSKGWISVFLSPNEEVPVVFTSPDKDVTSFKFQYRAADPVR